MSAPKLPVPLETVGSSNVCGIAGFQGQFENSILGRMNALIAHRGPDDSGDFSDVEAGIGLTHRRLSIIDLSERGKQPMTLSDLPIWITYNGEIYNFPELKASLEKDGFRFRSQSDTEVLLALYARDGVEMLEKLNGIFAFAIWDQRDHSLFVARDQLGTKPLYYSEVPAGFLFASEMKAIIATGQVSLDIDPVAIDQYLAFQWSVAPTTMLSSVKKLEPGQAMVVKAGSVVRKWRYYDVPYDGSYLAESEDQIAERVHEQLELSVKRQMLSDVPVGAFLSGGLDSSSVVAMMRKAEPDYRVPCYSIGFDSDDDLDGSPSDLPYARRVAEHLGVDLREIRVGPEIIDNVEKMVYHLDEPQGDPAPINAMLIAERARHDGIKVLLSGAGGDDIFSGYRRHRALDLESKWAWMPRGARSAVSGLANARMFGSRFRRVRRAFRHAGMDRDDRLLSYFLWSGDQQRRSLYSSSLLEQLGDADALAPLRSSLSNLNPSTPPLDRMLYLETKHFLADHNLNYTDKMAMAHGVEVRVPLLDPDLVALAACIPTRLKQHGRTGKYIFKKAMEPDLPNDVIYRPKTGFGAPMRRWIRRELTPMVDDVLSESSLRNRGLFDPAAVRRMIQDDRNGRVDASYTVFAVLCIEIWSRVFLDRPIAAP